MPPEWRVPATHFYPRPPRGGRPSMLHFAGRKADFYPRPPRGGRQRFERGLFRFRANFYPRPPRGGRLAAPAPIALPLHFYPRPPRGGRPHYADDETMLFNFYPRPPRGGRHRRRGELPHRHNISIHALREEGDHALDSWCVLFLHFYPRPLRGGRPITATGMN